MIIYLVRHGKSESRNGLGDTEAADKIPLSKFGIMQARALGRKLKKRKIEAVYSSSISRARETAEIISAACGVKVREDSRLNELVISRTISDKASRRPLRARTFQERNFIPPYGESFNQSVARFLAALQDIGRSSLNSACLVSHREIMQNVLMDLFSFASPPPIHETSVTTIVFNGGKFELISVNERTWSPEILWQKLRDKLFKS